MRHIQFSRSNQLRYVGVTHIPRPEEFPVYVDMRSMLDINTDVRPRMPAETVKVSFRPQSFFKINPSMDVPEAKDTESVLASNRENRSCCN